MASYIALAVVGTLVGYFLGTRNARKVKKQATQQLNSQSLELLDAKATLTELETVASEHTRRERLLSLSLARLQQANKNIDALKLQREARDKMAYIELSKMRMRAVHAQERAARVTEIARRATIHLKRLELASPATQTIEAHQPKSYGTGEPVTVSVVDQSRLDGSVQPVAKVSNRDSVRLKKLHSSNEATAVR